MTAILSVLQLSAIQPYQSQQGAAVVQQGLLKTVSLSLDGEAELLGEVPQSLRLAAEVADGPESLHRQQALLDVGGVFPVDERAGVLAPAKLANVAQQVRCRLGERLDLRGETSAQ